MRWTRIQRLIDFLRRMRRLREETVGTRRTKETHALGSLKRAMDEISSNFSDGMTELPPAAVVNAGADLRKRRSTRIVQAVPLSVTGVDAIGRPFTEHTSSLIINCHGCRYQSKHYVLKNM